VFPLASKPAAAPRSDPKPGNGCSDPLIVPAQGYFDEAPAWATLEMKGTNLLVNLVRLDTGARSRFRGTLEQSLCEHTGDGDLLGIAGTLRAEGRPQTALGVLLARNDYFGVDRGRLHFEGTKPGESDPTLTLWDTSPERLFSREHYAKALKNADDVEAVIEARDGALLVASLSLPAREITLTKLTPKPLLLKTQHETRVMCNFHSCNVALSGYELSPELTLLVVVTAGEDCGAKCTSKADAQLWTLTPSGFHFGAELPSSNDMPGGLNYEGSSSHTSLCWVDADGAPPLEVLALHTESNETDASLTVYGYDPGTESYSIREEQPKTTTEAAEKLCGGSFTQF